MDSIQNYTCSICLGLLSEPVTTACQHHFCTFCIEEMLDFQEQLRCPLCRMIIPNANNLQINQQLQQYIARSFPSESSARNIELRQQQRLSEMFLKLVIEYGNSHNKVVDPSNRGQNTESWTCFVNLRGLEGREKEYISRVEFTLHETFSVPLVKCTHAPFKVTRLGWGTFEIPIKIFWKKWLNIPNPTEVSWNLKFLQQTKKNIHTIKINKSTIKEPKAKEQATR